MPEMSSSSSGAMVLQINTNVFQRPLQILRVVWRLTASAKVGMHLLDLSFFVKEEAAEDFSPETELDVMVMEMLSGSMLRVLKRSDMVSMSCLSTASTTTV